MGMVFWEGNRAVTAARTRSMRLVLVGLAVSCGGEGEELIPWDPGPDVTGADSITGSGPVSSGESGEDLGSTSGEGHTSGGGLVCAPGETILCLCPDGDEAQQWCEPDGSGWSDCECEDSDSSSDSGGSDPVEVCFPGEANDFSTCLPIYTFETIPTGYEYPPALMGDPNYRAPIALIDLEQVDPQTLLSPNFRLVELAQREKGRYAVLQPHAIASIQALRDAVGAVVVNSGYRSPGYNASVDGSAMFSRHMYGDGFDLDPVSVGLSTLETLCVEEGGMLVEYNTHVHCDFRFDPVDEQLFGPAMAAELDLGRPRFEASLVPTSDGGWRAPALGFDEGEPRRRWIARDASGQILVTAQGQRFMPPVGTATITVRVGAQIQREVDLRRAR